MVVGVGVKSETMESNGMMYVANIKKCEISSEKSAYNKTEQADEVGDMFAGEEHFLGVLREDTMIDVD